MFHGDFDFSFLVASIQWKLLEHFHSKYCCDLADDVMMMSCCGAVEMKSWRVSCDCNG